RTYYRLFDHMILVSALLAGAGRHRERIEYMSALAFCYAMGGFTYHVFPAMGPIYRDEAIFAGLRDLPLISNHFHALLARTHAEATAGTLQTLPSYEFIACMPSLHMAHELVMLYYARHSRVA